MYVMVASELVTALDFDNVESQEDLTNLLKSPPTSGVKLVDITRPLAKQGGKGLLKNPIMVEMLNWEIQDPHPKYGSSILLQIRGVELAQLADIKGGEIIKNPSRVYLNSNQATNKMLMLPSFAKQVLLFKQYTGKVFLKITALNAKDPENNAPNNTFVLEKPTNPTMLAALEKALILSKEGASFEQIMQQVPVPSQNAIASSSDIFPTVAKTEIPVAKTPREVAVVVEQKIHEDQGYRHVHTLMENARVQREEDDLIDF